MQQISLIRKKIYLSFLLAALLLVTTGYFYSRSNSRYISTVLQVQQAQRLINQLETVLSLTKDTETGERGYVITRQERFLEPYNVALGSLQQELVVLENLTKSTPYQAARLPRLRRLIDRETGFLNKTIRLVRAGQLEAAAQLVAGGEGKRLLDAIRQLVGQMQTYEQKKLALLLRQVETEARLNNRVNLVGLVVLVSLFGVAAYTIVRDLRRQQQLKRELVLKNEALAELSGEQRRLLDQLYEAQEIAQVGSFDLDANGMFTGTPELYHIYGWNLALAGQPTSISILSEALHPSDRTKVFNAVATSFRQSVPYETQQRICLPDGTQKYLLARGKPTLVGSVMHLQGTVMDVTERQRNEQQLQALNQSLQTTNNELSAALEDLSAASRQIQQYSTELEQKNQDLEAFSYSVSHDLKTPLRSVLSFGGILEEEYALTLDEEGRRLLTIILSSARSMHELIEALLQFSRLGRTAVRKEIVDLDRLVRTMATEMTAADRPGQVQLAIAPLGTAWVDRQLIRQVWFNLLSNAIKFSAGQPAALITVACHHQGLDTVYSVADNGVGFAAHYATELFGVFKRLHSAEGFPGTGVGLAICQRIVTNHGGRIWAESQEGQGATFYFTLPSNPAQA
ncbi:sensor histidine kinase [Hymenobacter sp.]|jgi:signal transduction histidine kinase/CHASE3 domain sensor protein|uniref:sensor histidine kinase n=1 Tax=Hymenobacter sp. TaxID=1898978 RepID=UPI002ED7C577